MQKWQSCKVAKLSTDIDSPEVTRCSNFLQGIITLPCVRTWPSDPVIATHNECWVCRQLLLPFMSPFSNMIRALFHPPFYSSTREDWVVSLKFLKWSKCFGKNVGITAKKATTASLEALAAVLTWKVRPGCCLRQWNLSWLKGKIVLSSRIPSDERTSLLL